MSRTFLDFGRGDRGPMLTIKQVAVQLAVSEKTVKRLTASGQLPAHRIGWAVRISPKDLAAYLAARRTGG